MTDFKTFWYNSAFFDIKNSKSIAFDKYVEITE